MTRPSGARWSSVGMTSPIHCLFGRLEHGGQAVGGGLVGAEDPEVALLGVELDHVAEELAQGAGVLVHDVARLGHVDRVVAEVGQPQVAEQDAAVGDAGWPPSGARPSGASSRSSGMSRPSSSKSSSGR